MGSARRARKGNPAEGNEDRVSPGVAAARRARKPPRPRFGAPRTPTGETTGTRGRAARTETPPPADQARPPRPPPTDRLGDLYDGWSNDSLFPNGNGPRRNEPSRPDPSAEANGGGLDGAFALFELPTGASWRDVRRAHRSLAKRHHPDRWTGATADEQESAEQRMVEINGAYATLREHFGR